MLKQRQDYIAATDRLQQYESEGLLPNQANLLAIKNYIEEVEYGYLSVETVERAVTELRRTGELAWKSTKPNLPTAEPTAPPAPAQSAPAEQPAIAPTPKVLLADGSEQLDINTVGNHSHTVVQLKDLAARQRGAKSVRGFHGGGTL